MIYTRCPITYELLAKNETHYSQRGLHKLSRNLQRLANLKYSAKQLRQEARQRSVKMSLQGVQPKLAAILNIKNARFDIVDKNGKYILKPPIEEYLEIPSNEDLTMRMATLIGIDVPMHGLIYNSDNTFTYFIKRFDRIGHRDKLAVEDFAQLSAYTRETKYNSSMEKLIPIIDKFCTFPLIEKKKLFTRVLFNYLVGNEDMHLKNFSLIRRNNKVELAPAYDFVNSTIAIGNAKEEMALPLNGKKKNIKRKDLIDYYAIERLKLNEIVVNDCLETIKNNLPKMRELIDVSFLSDEMKNAYHHVTKMRATVLWPLKK